MAGREGTSLGLPGGALLVYDQNRAAWRAWQLAHHLLEPEFIHGPMQWEDCCFEVHVEADKRGGGYVLQDVRADFEVKTGEI